MTTGDGVRLPLACWPADGAPGIVILGLHGYGDYRRGFDLSGRWLAARGATVYAYDQRGFGETAARGQWPGADTLIDDLADVVAALRTAHPDLPLVVLGESMGGSVAQAGVASGRVIGVDALILAAPGVRGGVPLRQVHDLALRLGATALPWLAVELRRGGRPWLDPDESARLADDPLVVRELSVSTYDGLIELATRASADPEVEVPSTLVLYGELDGTIARVSIDDLAVRLGERCTVRIYPQGHHLLLHETAAAQVLADCASWLGAEDEAKPPPQ